MHELEWMDLFPAVSARVYIVDDDELVCESLAHAVARGGYASARFTNPEDFLESIDLDVPGCVLLDVVMPERDGLQVQQVLAACGCSLPIVFVSGQSEVGVAVQAMKHGAFDFVEKPVREQALIDVVTRAVQHDVKARIAKVRNARLQKRFATLTPREREVLSLLVEGGANKSIAADLGLSSRTVEIHRANIMGKLGAKSVAELVRVHVACHRA